MDFYVCLILLTELMMIAMSLHVITYSGFKKEQKVWYLLTFVCVMLCAGAEYAVHCGYYDPSLKIPLTVITVIQFSAAPMLGILFAGALGLRYQEKAAVVYLVLNFLTEVIAAPFGLVFYFDAEGYHRGDLFILYEAFYIVSLVYLIICLVIAGKKFRHRDMLTIGMTLVILIAGILPMTFFKLNVTYIAIAMSASLCYIYYNDLIQQDIKKELIAKQQKMSYMQEHMISGLASFIENRDLETGGHITRTALYVKKLAELSKADGVYADILTPHYIMLLSTLAPMHDIGKIVISDAILRKPCKLTEDEYNEMKKHASAGGTMVRRVLCGVSDEEYLSAASDIATYHHEWWDGSGYPKGLKGDRIPLSARIMAIADVYDALISERCYKAPVPPEEAFRIIERESGTHFDPALVKVFLDHKEEFIIK